jgi:hypothetical protein
MESQLMRKLCLVLLLLPLFICACRDDNNALTTLSQQSEPGLDQEFELTIFSEEQGPLQRFRHWVNDKLLERGLSNSAVENLATYLKDVPPHATSIPGATELDSDRRCPLFMGDRVTIRVMSSRIVDQHIDANVIKVVRTPNAKKAIDSLLTGRPIPESAETSTLMLTGESSLFEPEKSTAASGKSYGLTPDGQCLQRRGWLFTGHLLQKDLQNLYRNMVSAYYDPVFGKKLSDSMSGVRKIPEVAKCTGCYIGCCMNCVFQAFDAAIPKGWPVEEDHKTINSGQCARSFADYWKESYERRMKIKRVWWGAGDKRNIINDPLKLPPGSVVVWDVCGRQQTCPGGPGIGDIGIVTSGPTPDRTGNSEQSSSDPTVRQSGVRSEIQSWYPKIELSQQTQSCRGKIIGIFLPWKNR